MSDTCDLLCLDLERAEALRAKRPSVADAETAAERQGAGRPDSPADRFGAP